MSGGCGGWGVAVVTTVMFEGGVNVPTVNCMCVERGSVGCHFLDYDFGARTIKGISVEAKFSVDGCVGGKAWVCA